MEYHHSVIKILFHVFFSCVEEGIEMILLGCSTSCSLGDKPWIPVFQQKLLGLCHFQECSACLESNLMKWLILYFASVFVVSPRRVSYFFLTVFPRSFKGYVEVEERIKQAELWDYFIRHFSVDFFNSRELFCSLFFHMNKSVEQLRNFWKLELGYIYK